MNLTEREFEKGKTTFIKSFIDITIETQFEIVDEGKAYLLQAKTKEIKDYWIEEITRLREHQMKQEARLSEVEERNKRTSLAGNVAVLHALPTNALQQLHQVRLFLNNMKCEIND